MAPIARLGLAAIVLWGAVLAVALPATAHDELVAVTPSPAP